MADEQEDSVASPNEFAVFRIGGRDLKVGALTLWDLEQSQTDLQGLLESAGGNLWTQNSMSVVRIIARKLKPEAWESYAEALSKSCTGREALGLISSFNVLWQVSGLMGEAEAATEATEVQSGTGTSTESPPNSP